MRGLCLIKDDVVEAARRKKRKIHAEYDASVSEKEGAMRSIVEAQDRVVTLKSKNEEMKRHRRRGEKNYFKAADMRESTCIELAAAISAGAAQGTIGALKPLAAVTDAVLTSTTMELERLNRKSRILEKTLQTARGIVEGKVNDYDTLLRRQNRATEALNVEEELLNAVTEFMAKKSRGNE